MGDEGPLPLVLDFGSRFCKAGFGNEDAPRVVFPTVVGRPKHPRGMVGIGDHYRDCYVGGEAQSRGGTLNLNNPVEFGVPTNWADWQQLTQHLLTYEFKIDAEEHSILVTEPPMTTKLNREKMTEIMFELGFPAVYLAGRSVCAAYGTGKTTGLVVQMGATRTDVAPVYEGHAIRSATFSRDLGGELLTDYLQEILKERRHVFKPAYRYQVEEIKQNLGYVALNFDQEMTTARASSDLDFAYTAPNGETIMLSDERFRCAETFFDKQANHHPFLQRQFELGRFTWRGWALPSPTLGHSLEKVHQDKQTQTLLSKLPKELVGHLGPYLPPFLSLPEVIRASILHCDVDIQNQMWENGILCGGSSMFPLMGARLHNELIQLSPKHVNMKMSAMNDRQFLSWIGGSAITTLPMFQQMCISKEEYKECGLWVVHAKCS